MDQKGKLIRPREKPWQQVKHAGGAGWGWGGGGVGGRWSQGGKPEYTNQNKLPQTPRTLALDEATNDYRPYNLLLFRRRQRGKKGVFTSVKSDAKFI